MYVSDCEVVTMTNHWKREEGSVALIVAVAFVVLIGCGALAVDLGSIANGKRSLQNAVDAAALAAAQALPDEANAATAAQQFASSNGAGTVNVSFSADDLTVTVNSSRDVPYNFAQALVGSGHATVRARAVATQSNVFAGLDYALFSGSGDIDLQFTGGLHNNQIYGNVRSNANIDDKATVHDGTVTATGGVNAAIAVDLGYSKITGATPIPMPDYVTELEAEATHLTPDVLSTYGVSISGSNYSMTPDQYAALLAISPNHMIFIDGNVTFGGAGTYHVDTTGCLVASGKITFNGSGVIWGSSTTIALCSAYTGAGAITFNGGGVQVTGMIYAPNGQVTLDGNSGPIYGSVVADSINSNGGIEVHYDADAGGNIPLTKVRLVD